MSRLDDLTGELLDKLAVPTDAEVDPGTWRQPTPTPEVVTEIRQRLQAAWEEGQLAMRTRAVASADAAEKGGRKASDEAGALAVTEEFK